MRVLVVEPGASWSVQDVSDGWVAGLDEMGATVRAFNFGERLDAYASSMIDGGYGVMKQMYSREGSIRLAAQGMLAACFTMLPDVVIIISGFFVPPDMYEIIRARGIKIVFVCTESPYEDDRQIHAAGQADIVLLNDPTNLEAFRAINKHSYYVPHAYNPARHHPGPCDPQMGRDGIADFAFVGTGFPSRVEFFEQVDFTGLDAVFGGMWRTLSEDSPLRPLLGHDIGLCVDNAETAKLYRSTKTSLNLYRTESNVNAHSLGWSCGPREIELAASGCFFLRDSRPESDDLFPMLPTFTEPGEVRPLLDYYLEHGIERVEAAEKARAAIADRTFAANAAFLLQHLEE